jgi:hypothetical protein
MTSFQTQLTLRTVATILVASMVAIVLPTKARSAECKPSARSTHLTHLETLMIGHDLREAMSVSSNLESVRSDGESNR